jgi:tellurite resistance protein
MQVTITLTARDIERLEEIRKLREAQGRPWYSIEVAVSCAASDGIYDAVRTERLLAEMMESDTPALLARQVA